MKQLTDRQHLVTRCLRLEQQLCEAREQLEALRARLKQQERSLRAYDRYVRRIGRERMSV